MLRITQVGDVVGNASRRVVEPLESRVLLSVAFQTPQAYVVGASPRAVTVADLGNGHPDLVVANRDTNTLSVLLGNGDATFQTPQTITLSAAPVSVAIADLGNGHPDLVVSYQNSGDVSVLLGNGNGTFGSPTTFTLASTISQLAVANLGNGRADLVVSNVDSATISVLLGNGDGTFGTAQPITLSAVGPFAVADLGNGQPDVVVANPNDGGVSVLLGNGDGTFILPQQTVPGGGAAPVAVAVANLGRGVQDVVVANDNGTFTVFPGLNNGSLQTAQTFPAFPGGGTGANFAVTGLAVADLGNGSPDVIMPDFGTNTIGIAIGNGDGTFQSPQLVSSVTSPFVVAAADLGNGKNDLIATSDTGTVNVLIPAPQVKKVGGLDPTFGIGGLASHGVGFTATGGFATQANGQSIVAGILGSPGSEDFGVTRYAADGSLDTTFAGGGVASMDVQGTDDEASGVTLLPDGHILVAGTSDLLDNGVKVGSVFAVARFNADGSVDTTFGNGTGRVVTSFGSAVSTDVAHALVLGHGGEFFVVGSSTAGGTGKDVAIAAYNADGSPATGFNGTGRELLDFAGGDDAGRAGIVQPNGMLVVAGSSENPTTGVTSIAMTRLLPTGAVDAKFGTKGKLTTSLRGVDDEATSVALQPKGQIVVGGVSATGSFAAGTLASDFAVLRYTSAGKLDKTFGRGGSVLTGFGTDTAVTKVLVQADGKIVASGKSAGAFSDVALADANIAVARYNTNGTPDASFNGGKTIITLSGQTVTAASERPAALSPLDASTLQQSFNAFVSSAQGVVSTTAGGSLQVAGNSDGFTDVAQLIASGIDLAASLVAKLPATVKAGASITITIGVNDAGSSDANGNVTITAYVSSASTHVTGDTQVLSKRVAIKLKASKAKSLKYTIKLPKGFAAGKYFLVGTLNAGVIQDLNSDNNSAFKGPFQVG